MKDHVSALCLSCFWQLRQLRLVRSSLTSDTAKSLVHAFVSSRLDYCNSLLYGAGGGLLKKLRAVQNAAARVVTGTRKFDHITPVLRDLHWLPVRKRIKYKLAMIVYKCLHGWAPTYLADDCLAIFIIAGKRHLRSAGTGLLFVPRTRTTLGMRSYAVAGPVTWNSLPDTLRTATLSPLTFAGHLKAHLFALPRERVWGLFMTRFINLLIIIIIIIIIIQFHALGAATRKLHCLNRTVCTRGVTRS